jgi:hypothetical protein
LPIIFIASIVFVVLYLMRTKKKNYFITKSKKQTPFNDDTIKNDLNEMKFYGSNNNSNLNAIVE